ncbi:PaaX family transcriptional regulator C-terminal domain-containing protein [Sporolactobacillus pectinivorans]|uniref:PaaX family transcriptional regulator C-terminal domain-containing protein n=1 Tax=Sporolactobacillus pectinivorans TaxID=1591408 RepID=UPI000C262279|nr:PaaX family transcriptional regulator C-terminal domain-containing protein [Sporolactobacillus pectinivorans]
MLSLEKQLLYILMRKPNIEVSELLGIYRGRDYSAQSIRNAISRLKKSGYIDHRGRAYFLTASGSHFIKAFQDKLLLKDHDWNGSWQLVVYQIPEPLRRARNTLRQELTDLGYGQLFQSVFISPHDQSLSVRQIFSDLNIQPYVNIFSGHFIYGDVKTRMQEIWDLKKIESLYVDFISWTKDKSVSWVKQESIDSWDAFFHVLELGERFGAILLKDPMLPAQFLPMNWPGGEAWKTYRLLFTKLAASVADNQEIIKLIKDDVGEKLVKPV